MVDLFQLAEELKIDDIAVCHAGKFQDVEEILIKDTALGILPPFTEVNIHKRTEPDLTLSDAAGFIVILEHYEVTTYKKREGFYGNISPAASGEDYHRIVRRKLNGLKERLEALDESGVYLPYVDNSPFSEKHIALRAGLGQILKNGLFYSKKFGSRCFIGLILTNRTPDFFRMPIRCDGSDQQFDKCRSCSACQLFCPGNAIGPDGMNSYRCVSYLTQKKEALTGEEERCLGVQIYGCDICQKVCPMNPPVPTGYETGIEVDLNELMNMSNKQFRMAYQQMAAGWRGKKQLQKNAEIVMKNIRERNIWQHGIPEDSEGRNWKN